MTANVTKILAAAAAVSSVRTTGDEPPQEIRRYPAIYQYGREAELTPVGLGQTTSFIVTTRYTVYIVGKPGSTFSALDTLRSAFLAKLALQELLLAGEPIRSRQYRFQIGSDDCPVDQLTIPIIDDQYSASA